MQMQDFKRALYDFSAAIRAEQKKDNLIASELADYYMYAGQCNQMLGQYDEAISHYNYGIEKNNQSVELFYNRGLAYVSKGMY
jgi:tetratricopeptide (TPR) repeat protein